MSEHARTAITEWFDRHDEPECRISPHPAFGWRVEVMQDGIVADRRWCPTRKSAGRNARRALASYAKWKHRMLTETTVVSGRNGER